MNERSMQELTPSKIVEELDKYIIGQTEAKRAVAIEKLFLSLVLMTSNQADELEVISD